MEDISSNFQVAVMKLDNLGKAYDKLQSEASSFLLFSLQWKDLQEHFDSVSKSIGDRLENLYVRVKEVELKENQLSVTQERLDECSKLVDENEERLRLVQKSLHEYCKEADLYGKKLEEIKSLFLETSDDVSLKEKHLDSLKVLIQDHAEELDRKEKEWEVLQKSIADSSAQLKSKEEELSSVKKSIGECLTKIKTKESRLLSIEKNIEERSKELENKEKQLSYVQRQLRTYRQDIELKDREYGAITRSVEERNRELIVGEEKLQSIHKLIREREEQLWSRDEEYNRDQAMMIRDLDHLISERDEVLKSIQRNIEECNRDLGKKEKQLNFVEDLIKKRELEIKSKDKEFHEIQKNFKNDYAKRDGELKSIRKKIIQCDEELKTKEKALETIQKSMFGLSKELESERKIFDDLVAKEEELKSMQRIINEHVREHDSLNLQMKERSLELEISQKQFEERVTNIESKEKQFEEQVKKLELKEKQFEERVKELESKEKQFESLRKSFEAEKTLIEKSNILLPRVKTEQLDFIDDNCVKNRRNVLFLFIELLKKYELMCHEVSNALQASSDPAKLVLDAMQGFYPPDLSHRDIEEYDANIIRGCILLLDELKKSSPVISSHVKEESKKLASEWWENMSVANKDCLEVLCFLKFVATYELGSSFNANELQMLLHIISQHCQTSELRKALGIVETVPGDFVAKPLYADNQFSATTGGRNLQLLSNQQTNSPELMNNDILVDPQTSDPAKLVSATTIGRNLQLLSNHQTNASELTVEDILVDFQTSDPAKYVLDMIQNSIVSQSQKGEKGAILVGSHMSLLEQLVRISPDIKPHVREEAMKLAFELKAGMRASTENSMEVLGLLLFVFIYGLVSFFEEDEILQLFEIAAHQKQAVELFGTLGFADKISDFVQNLIHKQQPVEAVRFICAYKLADKFPPVDLLRAYVQNAKMASKRLCKKKSSEIKDKVRDEEVACLRTVMKCISDNNLESHNLPKEIQNRINELEKLKANSVGATATPGAASKVEVQEQPKQKKRSNEEVAKKHPAKPRSNNNKRPRTVASRPSVTPVFTPIYQPMFWPHHETLFLPDTRNYLCHSWPGPFF
ncbi:FRIGIDA-like protein 5 [Senna tora]|uniref:FRIGIDA-like protein 5 n=1 Tax=Senna tora TaxID=362788 RepID=A0A834W478_9FABA|nr:FRIGIDA-like protein 5 [Senna tora]